jgi:transposase
MPNTIAQRSVWTSPKTRLKFIFARPAGSVGSPMAPRAAAALICLARGVFVIARVAFEPSGAYHHAFERRLAAAGLPLVKVNPRQTRRLAEAIGRHAKTDAVDAAMLARFAALLEPPVRPVVSATVDAMKKLQVARRALVKDGVAAQNRGRLHRSPLLKRKAAERLRQIDRQIAAIDGALRT